MIALNSDSEIALEQPSERSGMRTIQVARFTGGLHHVAGGDFDDLLSHDVNDDFHVGPPACQYVLPRRFQNSLILGVVYWTSHRSFFAMAITDVPRFVFPPSAR